MATETRKKSPEEMFIEEIVGRRLRYSWDGNKICGLVRAASCSDQKVGGRTLFRLVVDMPLVHQSGGGGVSSLKFSFDETEAAFFAEKVLEGHKDVECNWPEVGKRVVILKRQNP